MRICVDLPNRLDFVQTVCQNNKTTMSQINTKTTHLTQCPKTGHCMYNFWTAPEIAATQKAVFSEREIDAGGKNFIRS